MKTSAHGITLLENREGIRLKVYKDSKGIPTVGVGHVVLPADNLKVGDHITQAQCDAFLAQDVVKCENAVSAVNVPLTQWQFDALVSFIFNIGVGGFNGSSDKRHLKAKEYTKAAQSMMMWVTPSEITGRRQTEVNQFLHPDHFYSQDSAASTATLPTSDVQTPVDTASSPAAPPITQTADTIVNTGDTTPTPDTTDITMNAPVPMGSVQGSTKVTILGITVPTFLVGIFQMLQSWVDKGWIDMHDVFSRLTDLIQQNFKYILILAALVIVVIMLKKVERIVVFIVSMITHAIPGWNSVSVVGSLPVVPQPWWKIW